MNHSLIAACRANTHLLTSNNYYRLEKGFDD